MKSRLAISFDEVVDRERKHPGEKAFGHPGASGKEASGIRCTRAPGWRVARAFLGLFTVLGRLALGLSPIEALGLGWLARGTESGPMIPTMILVTLIYLTQKFYMILRVGIKLTLKNYYKLDSKLNLFKNEVNTNYLEIT